MYEFYGKQCPSYRRGSFLAHRRGTGMPETLAQGGHFSEETECSRHSRVRVTQITLTALTVVVDIRTGRWAGVPGKFLRPRFRTCYIMSYCCCSKSTVCCVSWARSGPCLFCTDLCCVLPTDRISWTQEVLRNTGYGWECVVSMGRSPPITVCMCETRFERNKAVAA